MYVCECVYGTNNERLHVCKRFNQPDGWTEVILVSLNMLSQRLKITKAIKKTQPRCQWECVEPVLFFTALDKRVPAIEAFSGVHCSCGSDYRAGYMDASLCLFSVAQCVYLCVRVCEGYRMLLVGLGLQVFADVCRVSIILVTLCRCSDVGGGCRVLLWIWVKRGKKNILLHEKWEEKRLWKEDEG